MSNVVQMDEFFMASVGLNDSSMYKSPAMNYLDRDAYVTSDGTVEGIYPYAFSAKV